MWGALFNNTHCSLNKSNSYSIHAVFSRLSRCAEEPCVGAVSGEHLLSVCLQYHCVCVSVCLSLSPLHIAACGDSGAELVVQLSQSSIAILLAAPSLGLGGDGTRHWRDRHTSPFGQKKKLKKRENTQEDIQRSFATCIQLNDSGKSLVFCNICTIWGLRLNVHWVSPFAALLRRLSQINSHWKDVSVRSQHCYSLACLKCSLH